MFPDEPLSQLGRKLSSLSLRSAGFEAFLQPEVLSQPRPWTLPHLDLLPCAQPQPRLRVWLSPSGAARYFPAAASSGLTWGAAKPSSVGRTRTLLAGRPWRISCPSLPHSAPWALVRTETDPGKLSSHTRHLRAFLTTNPDEGHFNYLMPLNLDFTKYSYKAFNCKASRPSPFFS